MATSIIKGTKKSNIRLPGKLEANRICHITPLSHKIKSGKSFSPMKLLAAS